MLVVALLLSQLAFYLGPLNTWHSPALIPLFRHLSLWRPQPAFKLDTMSSMVATAVLIWPPVTRNPGNGMSSLTMAVEAAVSQQ